MGAGKTLHLTQNLTTEHAQQPRAFSQWESLRKTEIEAESEAQPAGVRGRGKGEGLPAASGQTLGALEEHRAYLEVETEMGGGGGHSWQREWHAPRQGGRDCLQSRDPLRSAQVWDMGGAWHDRLVQYSHFTDGETEATKVR